MPNQEDILFGKIAVKNRLVDEAQIQKAMALIERSGNGQGLGKLLLSKGVINPSQFQAIQSAVQKMSGGGSAASPRAPAAGARSPGEGRAVRGAPPPRANIIPATDVAKRDFSKLAGQPLDTYLRQARALGASDLHFQVDSPPFIRIHGELVYLKHPKLTPEQTEPRILEILDDTAREILTTTNDYDFCYVKDHGRYRASMFRQRKGMDAVFRIIPKDVPTLEELRLPDVLKKFTKYRQGIVLITGPSGSGKTATMTALVDLINEQQRDHIVMVEDPIEYLVPSKNCNVNQRQVHRHTETYHSALRSAMRSDPDYICVGEMRDLETVSMAITAAETGHLVFATLHTTNAVRSVDRIIDIFPPKEQEQIRAMVSESLRGVISQNLLPRADGLGREPALEILFVNSAIGNMIRERKTFQLASVLQTGSKEGMCTMDDSIGELLKKKVITRETAHYFSFHKDRFK